MTEDEGPRMSAFAMLVVAVLFAEITVLLLRLFRLSG